MNENIKDKLEQSIIIYKDKGTIAYWYETFLTYINKEEYKYIIDESCNTINHNFVITKLSWYV